MKTLTLEEAAALLKLHPEELRRRAKAGRIPAAKIGKRWVLVEEDLVNHIRSQYALRQWQALESDQPKGENRCRFSNAKEAAVGGWISRRRAVRALDAVLKRRTDPPRRSSTTS
jgi:excisionase family DNA binding protein